MANANRGLGKGLGALLGDAALRTDTSDNLYLPISQIEPYANQPRRHFDEEALQDLADSIREHGTAHVAKVSYSQMSAQMQNLGYENVFIGTVEGEPEETSCESVIEAVKAAGYTNVILRPLMVVAGDHANNDMAGSDDDSWKTMFEAADFTVDCQIAGLGEIADIQALYIAHTQAAIDALNA